MPVVKVTRADLDRRRERDTPSPEVLARWRDEVPTDEQVAAWDREDGVDDAEWGNPVWVYRTENGWVSVPDVVALRARLGLTQAAFAQRFGLAHRTVQEWEQKRRVPEGPARTLLVVIDREPEAVARALAATSQEESVEPAEAP